MTGVARGILPAYFADYWGREGEFASFHAAVGATHISALDDNLVTHIVDDSEDLGSLTVPALVVVGRHDFICGVRWAQELHRLIPRSELLILENSGHFGHIEEPENFAHAVTRFVTTTTPRTS
ncbi:MAG: proline iminopeptidase [Streptomyces sp.]|nr:proline iminopeptidase [Streptomyces sp.]